MKTTYDYTVSRLCLHGIFVTSKCSIIAEHSTFRTSIYATLWHFLCSSSSYKCILRSWSLSRCFFGTQVQHALFQEGISRAYLNSTVSSVDRKSVVRCPQGNKGGEKRRKGTSKALLYEPIEALEEFAPMRIRFLGSLFFRFFPRLFTHEELLLSLFEGRWRREFLPDYLLLGMAGKDSFK